MTAETPDLPLLKQWEDAQKWERTWWHTYPEHHGMEIKKGQIVAGLMSIRPADIRDKSVLDIGCGPFSLLQSIQAKRAVCLDPLDYGSLDEPYRILAEQGWNITRICMRGEDITLPGPREILGTFDEAWIYNCLQHVIDPQLILANAMQVAKRVRIFEWTDMPPYEGHLHTIKPNMILHNFKLRDWIPRATLTGDYAYDEVHLHGRFFAGVFDAPE